VEPKTDPLNVINPSNTTPEMPANLLPRTTTITSYLFPILYVVAVSIGGPLILLRWAFNIEGSGTSSPNANSMAHLFPLLSIIITALIFILGIINIIHSFQKYKEYDDVYCLNAMLIMKYGVIPLFIFYAIMSFIIFSGVGEEFRSVSFYKTGINIAKVGAWLLLIPGAFYGIQFIRSDYQKKRLSQPVAIIQGIAIIHGIAQFLFVADVLDATYLVFPNSRRYIHNFLIIFIFMIIAYFVFLKFRAPYLIY